MGLLASSWTFSLSVIFLPIVPTLTLHFFDKGVVLPTQWVLVSSSHEARRSVLRIVFYDSFLLLYMCSRLLTRCRNVIYGLEEGS
jgi:hypothetical protein